ncbi:DNA polymerase family B-domain-containing protein [Gorgonomyces haynaldii]|nr:DNA polymerase family B-domain-containing protein [Gorgonomyces haynaldii]
MSKKPKRSTFEEELEKLSGQKHDQDYEKLWHRPACTLDNSRELCFQQLEVDETIIKRQTEEQSIDLFGITQDGHSVVCHVHDFKPYYYVPAPIGFNEAHMTAYRVGLNRNVKQKVPKSRQEGDVVLSVEMVQKQSIYGYHGPEKQLFLKITVRLASFISACKRQHLEGFHVDGLGTVATNNTFESNIPYTLRFMIDMQMPGSSWVTLAASKYQFRTQKISNAQMEVDVSYIDLQAHQADGEYSKIAPLRILSFDIECAGRKGVFPDPQVDPVIQIASVVTVQGESQPFIRNVMTLNTCANIVGSHVMSFETEEQMLLKWSDFVRTVDPDIIIGYNINGFDFPYLLDRAEALKVPKFSYLGRITDNKTVAKDTRFSSKAYGTRDTKDINIEGRIQFDMLQVMQRDYKLRSYTLNSVCAHFLGEQKEDVHHSIITDLQNGNDETRRRLAVYCLKDAYLPQRLLDKLMVVINYMEMSRVTGVPLSYLLTRGQQIKVVSQLYRKAIGHDLLIPHMEVQGSDEQYEGAIVIEPLKGFYQQPIATLDFTSLYPSIMMAHNLCYSTWLSDKQHADQHNLVEGQDYIRTPNNDLFVVADKRKGLLPIILEDLLSARKKAKQDLKKETDPFKRSILDGRQLALKISANSVYGFTGATIGKLPLLAISSSVTAFGRVMIEKTKSLVEEKFTIQNGYQHNAQVVYGDTDSVMVKFGPEGVKESMDLGREAAQFVTTHFKKPINLDFEKVYFPYLLINKKRYAGLYWTKPDKHDKLDAKGIETVRRDSCRLVSTVIETSLYKLLIDRDVPGAEQYVKKTIADLLQNKVDLSLLVISKGLGKTDYAAKQAHNELAIRMRERDPGSAPNIGDRVSYVIIKGTAKAAAYEKAEDPIYVLDNNIPIDTKYYLDNQLAKPLMRIFEPVLGDKANSLLQGDHTRTISVVAPSSGGMFKFAKKRLTCLGCKTPLKDESKAVCEHCRPKLPSLYYLKIAQLNEQETQFAQFWTHCQNCQGSLHQDVLCTSQDCPIFYMRKKITKDLEDTKTTLERFDYEW